MHRQASWLQTLQASGGVFSSVQSWFARIIRIELPRPKPAWSGNANEQQEGNEKRKKRSAEVEREAGKCFAVGDDGNCVAGADESSRKAARRPGDAFGGHGGGHGCPQAFEQLCSYGFGGLHRFPQSGESG